MATSTSDDDRSRSVASSEQTGERIAAAWGRPGASARLMGVGESFVAWELEYPSAEATATVRGRLSPRALAVRIPWRDAAGSTTRVGRDAGALALVPDGIGPGFVGAWPEASDSPIGLACEVTAHVPGSVLEPALWGPEHHRAHARSLALLHSVRLPGRGPIAEGPDPCALLTPGPMAVADEAESVFAHWRRTRPDACAQPLIGRLMDAAIERCRAIEARTGPSEDLVLSHGDLCATNVVWTAADGTSAGTSEAGAASEAGAPDAGASGARAPGARLRADFIDFEWAQADDRARDVAIIGGEVWAGPWYVPMSNAEVDAFIGEYAAESRRLLPELVLDEAVLRARRDAWEAYEKTSMLVHMTGRALDGDAQHARLVPELRERLAARLGIHPGP